MSKATEKYELEPGIYFGYPEDQYHKLPYLSASGMKNLLVSPMDFWARSWMNPFKEEDDVDSEAKILGRAYHKRILEGSAAFYAEYAQTFEYQGQEEVLVTTDDLKGWCRDNEVKGYSKGKKADLIDLIQGMADASGMDMPPIYDVLEEEYKAVHTGKTFLSEKILRKIELSAKMIECHPALKYFFIGGYAEVTIIWDDEETGIRMKARLDYLKVNAVNDLKTFANMMNKPMERAIYGEIASRKYHIQGSHYCCASDVAKDHVRAGRVFGDVDPDWIKAFADSPPHDFNFIFQQKGPAPVSVGATYSRQDPVFDTGMACVRDAINIYKTCLERFGDDPWVDMREPIMLNHMQYPAYTFDA